MPTTATVTAIIHFVGLCVFSSQVPNDCGLHVLLPRVVYSSFSTSATSRIESAPPAQLAGGRVAPPQTKSQHEVSSLANATTSTQVPHDTPHVQDHVSLLVFSKAFYASNLNWKPTDLPGNTSYYYVRLDGDRVRFETHTKGNVAASLANLSLPHLQTECCHAMQALNPGFLPPYTGAAAVFDLPEGSVSACLASTPDNNGRMDTEVTLNTSGSLVISASTMTVSKEIRLKTGPSGDIEAMVANVPVDFLNGIFTEPQLSAINGVPHVHAYYQMGDGNSASCATSLQAWLQQFGNTAGQCAMTILAPVAGRAVPGTAGKGPPPLTLGMNFECSNTQWP